MVLCWSGLTRADGVAVLGDGSSSKASGRVGGCDEWARR